MDVRARLRRGYRSLVSFLIPRETTAEYERRALTEIDEVKNPEPSKLGSILDAVQKPVSAAAEAILHSTVGKAISSAVQELLTLLDQSASWSVSKNAIYERFRAAGHRVRAAGDIHSLELRQVDEMVALGRLGPQSESLAFAEGAGTGVMGLPGVAMDIPGLLAIALRAINEYAAYYGFDPSLRQEKAFIVMLLAVASAPTVEERRKAMTALSKLSVLLSTGDSRQESGRLLSMQTVTHVAGSLASQLLKGKSAQTIPVVGAGVAATFNAWFVRTVTHLAHQLYRERFLIEKRGPKIAVPVRA